MSFATTPGLVAPAEASAAVTTGIALALAPERSRGDILEAKIDRWIAEQKRPTRQGT